MAGTDVPQQKLYREHHVFAEFKCSKAHPKSQQCRDSMQESTGWQFAKSRDLCLPTHLVNLLWQGCSNVNY